MTKLKLKKVIEIDKELTKIIEDFYKAEIKAEKKGGVKSGIKP